MSNPFRSIKGGLPPMPPRMPMVVLDRFGKGVEAGHLVLFHNNEDLVFEVTDVRPILNPAMQANGVQAMQITLAAQFPVHYSAGQANRDIAIVGESQRRLAERAASNGHGDIAPSTTKEDQASSGIVLTDAPDPPAGTDESSAKPEGPCNECGWIGPVGEKCPECVVGTYEAVAPTLGDA